MITDFTPYNQALLWATEAHAEIDHRRKFTNEPYIVHPIEVSMILANNGHSEDTELLQAALLHDVVEDTKRTINDIFIRFGSGVAALVDQMTDYYTNERFPEMRRDIRKRREADRLSLAPARVQTLKYADLISNTRSIAEHDPNFAEVYFPEKVRILRACTKGDILLWKKAVNQIPDIYCN